MKKLLVPALVAACALPAFAGETEIGLLLDRQTFKSNSVTLPLVGAVDADPGSKNGVGARVGFGIVDFGPAHLQVNFTYHPKVTADIQGSAAAGSGNLGRISDEYYAGGATFYWRSLVSFGIGAEVRGEKLQGYDGAFNNESTTYTRPWARAHIGFAIPSPIVKPFVGLDVAAPVASKSFDINASNSDQLKAFAPKMQIGLYGGIRF